MRQIPRLGMWIGLCLLVVGCSRQFIDPQFDSNDLPALGIGDPAPPLNIGQWINGPPESPGFEGSVHVVEFWATWCGPCKVSMPHLSALQQEYGDQVTIIGITDEDVQTVMSFLSRESPDGRPWSEVITYHLATDNQEGTDLAYMKAAKQSGIPTAFIVGRKGTIEWIGHPTKIDAPLRQVVDGTWSQASAARERLRQQQLAENRTRMSELVMNGDWDGALEALDEMEDAQGPSAIVLLNRLAILQAAGRGDQAAAERARIVETAWNDPKLLNSLAWGIATSTEGRDLPLALRAAQHASELTDDKDGEILDTVARVHYEQGNLDSAIQWQRKAVEHNPGHPEIDAALEKYLTEKGELAQPKDALVDAN